MRSGCASRIFLYAPSARPITRLLRRHPLPEEGLTGVACGDDSCFMPLRGPNFEAGSPHHTAEILKQVQDDGRAFGESSGSLTLR